MTQEQHRRANELSTDIINIENNIKKWNTGTSFSGSTIPIHSRQGRSDIDSSHVNFEVLKALTLDTLNKKLSELQTEYDNL